MPTTLELRPFVEESTSEVQDVMSAVPHAIVRVGITVVAAVVCVLLWMSWIVQYPDVISARVSVTSENPPASVVTPIGGRLARLRVHDGQAVTNGTVLGIIEGAADSEAVLHLKAELDRVSALWPEADGIPSFKFDQAARLGELQPAYSEFLTSYRQNVSLVVETNHEQKITLLGEQIRQTRALVENLRAQYRIVVRQRELATGHLERIRQLAGERVQSLSQVEEAEAASLAKERECGTVENAIINTGIQVLEYEKTVRGLVEQRDEQRRESRVLMRESFKKLRAQAAIWEQQHVLKAPVDGTVSFFKFWSQHQHVQAQDEVMTIVPETGRLLGRITLKDLGAGKIREGQSVLVKLDDYPSHEYGSVSATVESLSLVPRDNTYVVTLRFNEGLITSYGRTLRCKQEMQGEAAIVTAKRRLIERLFSEIRHYAVQ